MDESATDVSARVVLGIDPGSYHLGWAVFRDGDYVDGGHIPLKGTREDRLRQLAFKVWALLGRLQPSMVGIEGAYVGPVSRLTAIRLGEARGIVIAAVINGGHNWVDVAPTQAKKALTGSGGTDKDGMVKMVEVWLGLQDVSEHHADAIGVALAAMGVATKEQPECHVNP